MTSSWDGSLSFSQRNKSMSTGHSPLLREAPTEKKKKRHKEVRAQLLEKCLCRLVFPLTSLPSRVSKTAVASDIVGNSVCESWRKGITCSEISAIRADDLVLPWDRS